MRSSTFQRLRFAPSYLIVIIALGLVLILQINEIVSAVSPFPRDGFTSADIQIGLHVDEVDRNEIEETPLELWEKSFVSKTNLPLVILSLDYIYLSPQFILENNAKTICFQEISIQNLDVDQSPKQNLVEREECVEYGVNYIASGDYVALIYNVYKPGYKDPYFYPFDERTIRFDLVTNIRIYDNDKKEIAAKSLPIVTAVTRSYNSGENLWILSTESDNNQDRFQILEMRRLLIYKILIGFVILLVFIVIRHLHLMKRRSDFFQVATGIFLGLWGMREILIPSSIATITLVDTIFLFLYLLIAMFIIYETFTRQLED